MNDFTLENCDKAIEAFEDQCVFISERQYAVIEKFLHAAKKRLLNEEKCSEQGTKNSES